MANDARELVVPPSLLNDDGDDGDDDAADADESSLVKSSLDSDDDESSLDSDDDEFTIDDLPREILVSILMATNDQTWVRHTVPRVCKEWNEIYRSRDASPLHELLEVDFEREERVAAAREEDGPFFAPPRPVVVSVAGGASAAQAEGEQAPAPPPPGSVSVAGASAAQEEEEEEQIAPLPLTRPSRPVVHASRVIAWAARRAGSLRRLHLSGGSSDGALEDFTAGDLGRLVAVAGPSWTEFRLGCSGLRELLEKPFWDSLPTSLASAGRLRSFVVDGCFPDVSEVDVEPLGQLLAGSLEELTLQILFDPVTFEGRAVGLPRFPESVCSLTKLRRLALVGHKKVEAVSPMISSLKKLEELELGYHFSRLPRELGELTALTRLDLSFNKNLWYTPIDQVFPAELGKLRSLRDLNLSFCRLRAVPAFVGELEALEVLDLSGNDGLQFTAPLDYLVTGCPRLREVRLGKGRVRDPWTPGSRTHLAAFKARLLAENAKAKVVFE